MKESEQIRYLLGLCSPAERERIEAEYFSDAAAFQKMLAAEDDLIDAYARGELTGEERRRFETHFLKTSRGRDRVQFARAFAGLVTGSVSGSVTGSVTGTRSSEVRPPAPLLDGFKTFRARTVAIAAAMVVLVVVSWLVLERRRLNNELSEQRAKSVELGQETEAAKESAKAERARAAELAAELQDLRAQSAQSEKPKDGENSPGDKRRASRLSVARKIQKVPAETATNTPTPETQPLQLRAEAIQNFQVISTSVPKKVENVPGETVALRAGSAETPVNVSDATLNSSFESKKITELPLEARNVPSLLTLQTGTTRDGYVPSSRADQANITLEGLEFNPAATPPDSFFLSSRFRSSSSPATIYQPNSATWIRLKLDLARAARHTDYRAVLQSADGGEITSVDWIEPLTPNQQNIETPVISTVGLPSGDYKLLLLAKEPNGLFVRVDLYSFKLIRN